MKENIILVDCDGVMCDWELENRLSDIDKKKDGEQNDSVDV